MGAVKRTTLHDLAMNFHKYMFGDGGPFAKPIAKGFTVDGHTPLLYWEILDVRQDGTYPCVSSYTQCFPYDAAITIHHVDNK